MHWRTELFREADQFGAECDAYLAQRAEQRALVEKGASDRGVIFKQNADALVPEPTMDAPLADALILSAGWIGDELGKVMRRQADDISGRLDELESRLDQVEARLSELEGGNNKSAASVVQLRERAG